MRPIVITEKHIIQLSPTTVASGAIAITTLCRGVAVVDKNVSLEVEVGSRVSAIYVELWVTTDDDAIQGSVVASIEKLVATTTGQTFSQSAALFNYANKKNIFVIHQGLINKQLGVAMPVFREWIKIPKSKQRMGLDDHIVLNVTGLTNGVSFCGTIIYKEQK